MPLRTYYVSLTRDLIGCYLAFQAVSEQAVRQYLQREYLIGTGNTSVWKLPWCAIYDKLPTMKANHLSQPPVIIGVRNLILEEEDRIAS